MASVVNSSTNPVSAEDRARYSDSDENEMSPLSNNQTLTLTVADLAKICRMANGHHHPVQQAPKSGLGNPGPLGLAGFATTTFVLSCFNAGVFIDRDLEHVVLPLALAFGGIAQFIAGLYEFKIPNTFGATAFCSYGAFWVSFAAYVHFVAPRLNPASAHNATGIFLLGWTIFTFYMTIAAWRISRAIFSVFFFLIITFILLTAGALAESDTTTRVGGWFGLVTALCAYYSSAAVVINSSWGYTLLPIGVVNRKPVHTEAFWHRWVPQNKNPKV